MLRLIDGLHPTTEAGLLPAQTREQDRRLTLREPPARDWTPVEYVRQLAPERPLTFYLPDSLRGFEHFELRLQLIDDGEIYSHALDPIEVGSDRRAATISIPEALEGRESIVELLPSGARAREQGPIETPEIDVPTRSVLRFALGAPREGAAGYRIEACEGSRCQEIFSESLGPQERWQERSVDLDRLAGKRVRLRFETTTRDGAGQADGVWANPTLYSVPDAQTRAANEPDINLLLISLDTLAAGHLSGYGAPRATSPFLDEHFGRYGTVVERLLSAEVHTGPSHMSLFTSLAPTAHGVRAGSFDRLPYSVDTLALKLREAGLDTGAITENAAIFVGGGFERGFDEYREIRNERGRAGAIDATLAAGRQWIDRHLDRRFFLFLHTYQPHWPYEVSDDYTHLFDDDGQETPLALPPDLSPTRYDRGIRFVDDSLGAFFDFLRERDLLDRTLVVVTSDHGEAFLEHGQVGHGAQLYAEATHVPLLMAGPGVPAGRRLAGTVSQIDLAPTLLELLGAGALPDAMGTSFRRWLQTGIRQRERAAFSEAWYGSGRTISPDGRPVAVEHHGPSYAVEWNGHKLIRRRARGGQHFEHYLLPLDPAERSDVAASELPAAAKLRARLERYERAALAKREALRKREGDVLGSSRSAAAPTPDAERIERLRDLGYLE